MNEVAQKWTDKIIEELNKQYVQQGRKASGRWGRELESRIVESTSSINIKIIAPMYTGAFDYGRKPTSKGKQGRLYNIILQWAKDKDLGGDNKPRFAFLVSRKIDRVGIRVPNAFNPGRLVEKVITDEKIKELGKSLQGMYVSSIKSDLIKQWQSPK